MDVPLTRRLGDVLVERGFVSAEQLQQALRVQYQEGKRLGEIFLETGAISADQLDWALAESLGIPYVELRADMVDFELARSLPEALLRHHEALPILRTDESLTVVLADPTDQQVVVELERLTGTQVLTAIASRGVILELLDKAFPPGRLGRIRSPDLKALAIPSDSESADVAQAWALLLGALREDATELHLEPLAQEVRVRFRLPDGLLAERARLPRRLLSPLTSRFRTLGGVHADSVPCEASLRTHLEGHDVQFELLFFPTLHGEAVTVKISRRGLEAPTLESLTLEPGVLDPIRRLASGPGLVLVTGWDGRLRAPLLYALAREVALPTKKVITLERAASFTVREFLQIEVPGEFAEGAARILAYPTDVALVEDLAAQVTCLAAIRSVEQGALVLGGLSAAASVDGLAHLLTLGLPRVPLLAVMRGMAHVRSNGTRYGVDVLPVTDTLRHDWLTGPTGAWTSRIS